MRVHQASGEGIRVVPRNVAQNMGKNSGNSFLIAEIVVVSRRSTQLEAGFDLKRVIVDALYSML
jgi:hypothetical protein